MLNHIFTNVKRIMIIRFFAEKFDLPLFERHGEYIYFPRKVEKAKNFWKKGFFKNENKVSAISNYKLDLQELFF